MPRNPVSKHRISWHSAPSTAFMGLSRHKVGPSRQSSIILPTTPPRFVVCAASERAQSGEPEVGSLVQRFLDGLQL